MEEKKKSKKVTSRKTNEKKVVKTDKKQTTKKKKKAFTLIELLAVIIILGILMIIAIPSVTTYINNSRKSAYVDTAKQIVSGARNKVNEGKLDMFSTDTTYYIPASYIETENASKSPYGEFTEAYVGVIYNGQGYKYYWISRDETGQGVKELTLIDKLDEDKIESDIASGDVNTTIRNTGIGNGKTIKVLEKDESTGVWSFNTVKENATTISEDGDVTQLSNKICRRATKLHTAICNGGGCRGANNAYTYGETITYGNTNTTNKILTPGDAFDCNVNDDDEWNPETERFYYVTDEGSNAVLIYYTNVAGGITPTQNNYAYDASDENYHGPRTASGQLPSTTQWSNSQIVVPGTRQIVSEAGTIKTNDGRNTIESFTYSNKAARLLTSKELIEGCNSLSEIGNSTSGELDGCNYLMENIGYYEKGTGTYGYWLETPKSTGYNYTWRVEGSVSRVTSNFTDHTGYNGVRPVITISKSDIDY